MTVAAERNGRPIMLHTHYNHTVARRLMEQNRIPGLEGAVIIKAEHTVGHSRFDFLLRKDNRDILLEVKSCTLMNYPPLSQLHGCSGGFTDHRSMQSLSSSQGLSYLLLPARDFGRFPA